jgi:DNA-binding HxlR family transcriptional regulator
MTTFTKRDVLWDAILRTAMNSGSFSTEDVRESFENIKPNSKTTPAYDTIRDCLSTLEQMGYIVRWDHQKDGWKITQELLDPKTAFDVLSVVIKIGVETRFVKTREVMKDSSVNSETLVTLSLELLEQEGFVQRRSEDGLRSEWYITI